MPCSVESHQRLEIKINPDEFRFLSRLKSLSLTESRRLMRVPPEIAQAPTFSHLQAAATEFLDSLRRTPRRFLQVRPKARRLAARQTAIPPLPKFSTSLFDLVSAKK